jgi:CheY-like chemotaxis protein
MGALFCSMGAGMPSISRSTRKWYNYSASFRPNNDQHCADSIRSNSQSANFSEGRMSETVLSYDQFVAHLRSALHYLYDPVHLRGSALVELLGLAEEFDRAAALQQTLSGAIRSLKPATEEAPQSRAWRVYDLLNFQYVRQLTREEVATQLGISERQLRREQRVALEVLAQHLWPRIKRLSPVSTPPAEDVDPVTGADQALSQELGWLKQPAVESYVPLGVALQTVQKLAQPLAQQWRVALQVTVHSDLRDLPVAPLALRSILLTTLSVVIPQAGQGPVVIAAARAGSALELMVMSSDANAGGLPLNTAGLQTIQNLATFYDAELSFAQQEGTAFAITFILPSPEQIPVLLIDDNSDWLALLQRYAAGSRYQVIGTNDPLGAVRLAEQLQPATILLDVMMHNVDGWEILSELRHGPATATIPVVICTILPVAELALALGANAFLQKPVTQQQLLWTLDQQSKASEWMAC